MLRLTVLFLVAAISHPEGEKIQTLPYIHYISTGENTFVVIDDEEIFVDWSIKPPGTNLEALEALQTLKWNTLYLNTKGKIFLHGYFNQREQFVLVHWHLKAPFDTRFEKEQGSPETQFTISRTRLLPWDFKPDLTYDPIIYQRAKN